MALPNFKTDDAPLTQLQSTWGAALNPVLNNPIVNGVLLKNQVLTTGSNTISHKLGRPLQGWIPVRVRASVTLYDTQDSNANPGLTLLITSSGNATVDLYVF